MILLLSANSGRTLPYPPAILMGLWYPRTSRFPSSETGTLSENVRK